MRSRASRHCVSSSTSRQLQRTAFTQCSFPESFQPVPDGVSQGKVQPVVRDLLEFQRPAHLETKAAADEQEGNVVQGVGVSLAEFVGPNDQRVVEQAAVTAG